MIRIKKDKAPELVLLFKRKKEKAFSTPAPLLIIALGTAFIAGEYELTWHPTDTFPCTIVSILFFHTVRVGTVLILCFFVLGILTEQLADQFRYF